MGDGVCKRKRAGCRFPSIGLVLWQISRAVLLSVVSLFRWSR